MAFLKKSVRSSDLSEDQKRFVVENHKTMSRAEMARSIGKTWYSVGKFCRENNLEAVSKKWWLDEEYREKQSETQKKKWRDQEYRESQSEAMLWSEERKQRTKEKLAGKRLDRSPAMGFYVDEHGYKYLTGQQEHPLSTKAGVLMEHRKVLYDEIGPGSHECHWGCGRVLEWVWPEGITVEHLDNNPRNNDRENLAPACRFCNASGRARREREEKRPV